MQLLPKANCSHSPSPSHWIYSILPFYMDIHSLLFCFVPPCLIRVTTINSHNLSCVRTWIKNLKLWNFYFWPGVAADLSHIETPSKVTAHQGQDQLEDAVAGCSLVIIPAGLPRKPGIFFISVLGYLPSTLHLFLPVFWFQSYFCFKIAFSFQT